MLTALGKCDFELKVNAAHVVAPIELNSLLYFWPRYTYIYANSYMYGHMYKAIIEILIHWLYLLANCMVSDSFDEIRAIARPYNVLELGLCAVSKRS